MKPLKLLDKEIKGHILNPKAWTFAHMGRTFTHMGQTLDSLGKTIELHTYKKR